MNTDLLNAVKYAVAERGESRMGCSYWFRRRWI